jgi:hydroxymethylpyrimidine/phosphomethylpyrimidine kinase
MMRKQDNFLENILVKAAAKIQAMGPKYVVIKGEHGALLFHDLQVFFAPALPLEEVLIQQEGDTLRVVLQDLLHKVKTYHSKT